MRRTVFAAMLGATLLAGCGGPKPLALPADPVDRAATCAVVAAAEARVAVKDVQAPLPLAAQGRVVHYGLLAASAQGHFEAETANAVNRRMNAIEGRITGGRWQALAAPCRQAYPAAANAAPALPPGRLDAGMACEELAEFMANAFDGRKDLAHQVSEYRTLRRTLNDRLAPALKTKVQGGFEAQQAEGRKALARAAGLGPPTAVLDLCLARFGH